jgi:hypothetical protein
MNWNNESGMCICSFTYGLDKICIFEHPDINKGYIDGWVFTFNTHPYFWSIAGGSERLAINLAAAYAKYLSEHDDLDQIEKVDEGWSLTDDAVLDFYTAFDEAMTDAGFTMDEEGRYVSAKSAA